MLSSCVWHPVRAFLYGFCFFGGMLLITELAYRDDSVVEPIWGFSHSITLAAVGGVTFVISWAAFWLLWQIYVELIRKAPDA